MYKVYILLCNDLSFYVGYTESLQKRLNDHNDKQGAKYLFSRLPVKLVYYENYKTKQEAIKREKQLKGWSKIKKNQFNKIWASKSKIVNHHGPVAELVYAQHLKCCVL